MTASIYPRGHQHVGGRLQRPSESRQYNNNIHNVENNILKTKKMYAVCPKGSILCPKSNLCYGVCVFLCVCKLQSVFTNCKL